MTDALDTLTITPEMNKKLMLLTASLLKEYEMRLCNDVCNDWDFPKNWTAEEAAALTEYYNALSDEDDWYEGDEVISCNVSVVWLLRTILTGAAERL